MCIQSIRFTQFIIDADIVYVKTNLMESNFTLAGFKFVLNNSGAEADVPPKSCFYTVKAFQRAIII